MTIKAVYGLDPVTVCLCVFRVLSDWLEVKLGGDADSEEQRDGFLRTLCVSNSLQERGQRTHKVHITVKVSLKQKAGEVDSKEK